MDNEEIDPVSGNPVPPGAEPENVRDDIDAKLSEGEFVIPANVVKFIGVEKIMSMVKKAEEGLAELEEAGMTGKPALEEDDVELPFDESELEFGEEDVQAFAEGGLVQGDQVGNLGLRKYQDRLGFIRYMPYSGSAANEKPKDSNSPTPDAGDDTQELINKNMDNIDQPGDGRNGNKPEPNPSYTVEELSDQDLQKAFNQQQQITSFMGSPAGRALAGIVGKAVPGAGFAALAQKPIEYALKSELEKRGIEYSSQETRAFDDNYYGAEIGNSGKTMGDRYSGQSSVVGTSGGMATKGISPTDFKGSLPDLNQTNKAFNDKDSFGDSGRDAPDKDSYGGFGDKSDKDASPGGLY